MSAVSALKPPGQWRAPQTAPSAADSTERRGARGRPRRSESMRGRTRVDQWSMSSTMQLITVFASDDDAVKPAGAFGDDEPLRAAAFTA